MFSRSTDLVLFVCSVLVAPGLKLHARARRFAQKAKRSPARFAPALFALVSFAGCGATPEFRASRLAATPASTREPNTLEIEAATARPSKPESTNEQAPVAAGEPAAPRPDDVPAECTGADLDLNAIFSKGTCQVSEDPRPAWPTEELGLEIVERNVSVKRGSSTRITLAIVNRTNQSRALDVDITCGKDDKFSTEVVDAQHKRIDYLSKCGGGVSGCGEDRRRIVLPPQGRARVSVAFRAITRIENDQCRVTEKPMPSGQFTLNVLTPFRDPEKGSTSVEWRFATAVLHVK